MSRSESLTVDVEAGIALAERMARWLARQGVPIDELTAEALYALVYASAKFDPTRQVPFQAFARMVIRHQLYQFVKRWRRHHATGPLAGIELADPRARDPVDLAESRERCQALRQQLPARTFQILWQHFAEGRPMDDVAARHGVSRQRVQQIASRAIAKARAA